MLASRSYREYFHVSRFGFELTCEIRYCIICLYSTTSQTSKRHQGCGMRIVAGKFKGRRLKTVKGSEVRPTADRVKESLFRIFGEQVVDADFLDLCAGTGNIGLEALSQGARSTTFVDNNYHSIRTIESNLEMCGFDRRQPHVQLIHLDARKALARLGKRKAKFDLIYFDPPYASKIHESCVKQIAEAKLLSPVGVIVVEHRKVQEADWTESLILAELALSRQERYGDTILSFFRWHQLC